MTNPENHASLLDAIDAILPQTQCTKCGYDGCRPYAQAIANGQANINQCPPGGAQGIRALAGLLNRPAIALNPGYGSEGPRQIARIDPALCIGCALCIKACPVDAIIGAPKWMHTVLPELCTGCDLCIAPCPVDCIDLVDVPELRAWTTIDAANARARYEARKLRLKREKADNDARLAARVQEKRAAPAQHMTGASTDAIDIKRQAIEAALTRARERRAKPATAGKA